MKTNNTIYLKHRDGAVRPLGGKRYATLKRELQAGRGGPEIATLAMNGYIGFLGPDGEIWDLETLSEVAK